MNALKMALLAGSVIGMAASAPAWAEIAAPPAPPPAADEDVGQIVVTARRVEERLQDVPISISVFSQQQLASRNITYAADLAAFTPSLSVNNEFGADNTAFALRGFSQQVQTSPTVGVFFADVVEPRGGPIARTGDGAGVGDLFDLQNVQVLKGPQGTLFGRNTTGGDVLLAPKKPNGRTEGYLEVSAGNYGMERVQAVFNTPVNDRVRIRLGADQQTRDGYLDNVGGTGPSHFGDIDYVALRASLVVDVTQNVENYTIVSYARSSDNGSALQMFTCDPAPASGLPLLLAPMACAQLAHQKATGDRYAVENDLPNATDKTRKWSFIDTTTWHATDDLTVKNIVSYAQIHAFIRTNLFGNNLVTPSYFGPYAGLPLSFTEENSAPGGNVADQQTFSEELQFQGRALDGRLQWQAGGYLELSNPVGVSSTYTSTLLSCTNEYAFQCLDVIGALVGAQGAVGSLQRSSATILYRNVAGYAQSTYALTSQLKLTAGIRYTSDYSKGESTQVNYVFPAANTPVASCTSPSASLADNCAATVRQASAKPTWVLDLDYKPTEDVLAYAKYSRGYRQGNVNGTGVPEGFSTFQPETVDVYELGSKTSFRWPFRGTFDFAAFYNDFSNEQLLASFFPVGAGTLASGIVNAGKSRIWGLEFEATASPVQGLNLDLSYTYLNSKLESQAVLSAPGYTIAYGSVPGDALPLTPQNKASLAVSYTLPLDRRIGSVSVGGTYVYTDATFISASTPYGTIPAYGILGFNVNWTSVYGRPVDLSFFMTNATDKFYASNVVGLYDETGFESRVPGEPRMFGFRARYHFGS